MKKDRGIALVLLGAIMTVFQILSIVGCLRSGQPLPTLFGYASSTGQLFFDLFRCLGYYGIGIVGIILLFRGWDDLTS